MDSQTLHAVVRLPLHETWWLWRGSRLCSLVDLKPRRHQAGSAGTPEWDFVLRDPMDHAKYDEETAFPSLKPNIEIFGTPARTRKQRGWYQVVEKGPCSTRTRSPPHPPRSCETHLATASDLPAELIAAIVEEIRSPSLAQCALVCRHWAAVLQPEIFKTVVIRHTEDSVTFLGFLRPAFSNLRNFRVLHFRLHHSFHSPPFLHAVMSAIPKLLPRTNSEDVVLEFKGPLQNGLSTMRSVHCQLARQLPRETSSGIQILKLADVRFHHFGHLIQVLYELPSLETLEGDSLTWPPLSGTASALASPGLRRWLLVDRSVKFKATLTHSTQYWPFFLLTCVAQRTIQDRTLLCDLVQAIESSLRQDALDLFLSDFGSADGELDSQEKAQNRPLTRWKSYRVTGGATSPRV